MSSSTWVQGSAGMGRDRGRGIIQHHQSQHTPFISYNPAPGDDLQICPYDQAHRIRSTKMETHLLKCRRNYLDAKRTGSMSFGPGGEIEICPYNSSHHMPALTLGAHTRVCPQAPKTSAQHVHYQTDYKPNTTTDTTTTAGPSTGTGVVGGGISVKKEVVEDIYVEDWDEECKYNDHTKPSYDPIKKIKADGRLTYVEAGLSKNQRRRRLDEEDARIQLERNQTRNLKTTNTWTSASSSTTTLASADLETTLASADLATKATSTSSESSTITSSSANSSTTTTRKWGGFGRGRAVGDVDPHATIRRIRNDPTARNSLRGYCDKMEMDMIPEENQQIEIKEEEIVYDEAYYDNCEDDTILYNQVSFNLAHRTDLIPGQKSK